ncbi:MAG: hypothetical protein IJ740_20080 [Ruminococcus sp.]|nr:hypothetical protein [Ruminococcus sp.]MBR1753145.1 hypothetical protein [Ruminococcus sp.]
MAKKKATDCESCINLVYDEELGCDTCLVEVDEDEYYRMYNDPVYVCPYYRLDDEYGVVRKQN